METETIKNSRESFVFYRSFYDAIMELSQDDQLAIFHAIATYSLDHEPPQLEGLTKIVWLLIKPQLDANWRKFEKGCRGGAPKGNANATRSTTKQPQNNLKQPQNNLKQPENNLKQPNDNDNVNDNDNDNDNIGDDFIFTYPTRYEISHYIETNRLQVEAESFYDYYTSNGWMIGSNPMMDWKAALRNWNRKATPEINEQHITITYDL